MKKLSSLRRSFSLRSSHGYDEDDKEIQGESGCTIVSCQAFFLFNQVYLRSDYWSPSPSTKGLCSSGDQTKGPLADDALGAVTTLGVSP